MSSSAVQFDRVGVTFASDRGPVVALSDVTLDVAEGELLSVLGPSGCGKSTLLRVVADLVEPTEGSARVLGTPPADARRARNLGFVFQDSALLPWRTAIENVRLPLEVGPKGESARDPESLLELMGLADRLEAYPHELSGGMRQRVAIARALVTRPRILLMDEPFGALDEITRDRLNEELLSIWERTGTTVLFVTHSVSEAAFLGSRTLVLDAHPGRVRDIVPSGLGYPRELAMRDTAQFVGEAAELRKLLEEAS